MAAIVGGLHGIAMSEVASGLPLSPAKRSRASSGSSGEEDQCQQLHKQGRDALQQRHDAAAPEAAEQSASHQHSGFREGDDELAGIEQAFSRGLSMEGSNSVDSDGSSCELAEPLQPPKHSATAAAAAAAAAPAQAHSGCACHPHHACADFEPDADRTGACLLLPPLEELGPGQPWGLPACKRMHARENEAIGAWLRALPDPIPPGAHPQDVLHGILTERGYLTELVPTLDTPFRRAPHAHELASYDNELVAAVRADDVAALRAMRDAGRCMSACNRFGESILHTAARRGSRAVVAFLLESGAPPGACDDCGRNALHQALWTAEPRFDVVTLLVNADVRLLRCVDKRGAPPLQYARPEHWELWCRFFHSKKHLYWPDLGGRPDVAGVMPRVAPAAGA